MPIPRYNPQVNSAALPTPRVATDAPIEAFGGGASAAAVGEAGRDLGRSALKIAAAEKDRADDVATQDMYKDLVMAKNNLIYDPQNGALTRRGKDALGAMEEFTPQFEKTADEIEKRAANETQRGMFRKMRMREGLEFSANLERHASQEGLRLEDETFKSLVTTVQDDAIKNMHIPGKVRDSVGLMTGAAMAYAGKRGFGPEQSKQLVTGIVSKTHAGVIGRMLANGDDMMASAYYKGVKGDVTGGDSIGIERALEEGTLRGASQRSADKILSENKELSAAMDAVKKIDDPKLRDATEDRVRRGLDDMKRIDFQRKADNFKQASDIVEATKSRDHVPPGLWAELPLTERNAIDARAKQLQAGIQPTTDWGSYYELMTMASSPATREQFKTANLFMYRTKMADPEFKQLVSLQAGLRSGKGEKEEKELDGFRTNHQIVNDALTAAGIDPTPKPGKDDATSVALFRRMVDERVGAIQEQTKKKATNEEVQGVVDTLMVEHITKLGTFRNWIPFYTGDTTKRAFEIQPGDIAPDAIPKPERLKIEGALRAMGKPVTAASISELYRLKLQSVPRGR